MQGEDDEAVKRIILTASGGPFLRRPLETFPEITLKEALRHPNWAMGAKITVDSATMMNKGLEVIEARWLFNADPDQIEVLVHPQSVVHSMVAYRDGSVLAQMGTPDMRTPIAHALAWPARIEAGVDRLNLAQMNDLSFEKPDLKRFPCLGLAFEAMASGASAPVTLNAANEIAVAAFLDGTIGFDEIPCLVADVMERIPISAIENLEDVMQQDQQARREANDWVKNIYG
jgi:1-deoxy-D-xylulose-5-phosphate reductoisomerase